MRQRYTTQQQFPIVGSLHFLPTAISGRLFVVHMRHEGCASAWLFVLRLHITPLSESKSGVPRVSCIAFSLFAFVIRDVVSLDEEEG
jgi:hypothetical protein